MSESKQISAEEVEKEIKKADEEFRSTLEKLYELELNTNELKDKSFQLLRELHRSKKFTDTPTKELEALEKKYDISELDVVDAQLEHYKWLQSGFRQSQKLRQLQTNYLIAVVNGKQKEIDELKEASSRPPSRANNIA